mmetsp:Transcript_34708/g.110313  ORF Transcript_34708/g.110313 Transcript_34708/m.110313 type:complete len:213 (+) Transcript_34708:197-835(+)
MRILHDGLGSSSQWCMRHACMEGPSAKLPRGQAVSSSVPATGMSTTSRPSSLAPSAPSTLESLRDRTQLVPQKRFLLVSPGRPSSESSSSPTRSAQTKWTSLPRRGSRRSSQYLSVSRVTCSSGFRTKASGMSSGWLEHQAELKTMRRVPASRWKLANSKASSGAWKSRGLMSMQMPRPTGAKETPGSLLSVRKPSPASAHVLSEAYRKCLS